MAERKVVFDNADAYERFMGRWSRAAGEKFIAWLDPPKGARWLDVGCGTGAFTELIVKTCQPASIAGVDPAPAQIEHAKKQAATQTAEFQVGDSMALPYTDGAFDVVASALVIHFIPDRAKAFAEMLRVARAGGIVSGYTWDRTATTDSAPYAPMAAGLASIGAEVMRSPVVPEASPEGLRPALERAGFRDIAITTIEASQSYRDFDDYWQAQTVTFHPTGKSVAALSDADRERLRATMRKMLPAGADGSIRYAARATAFKARKPG
jgi:ubiquinone/menaquinone biosynthesis C-methylase UbiE